MVRTLAGRIACWTTLVSLAVVFAAAGQPTLGADGPVKKALAKRGRRLPARYEQAGVTDEQREQILKIQDEYKPKLDAIDTQIATLKKDLGALKKERDDKIAAVLTAEQKKKLEEAAAKGKDKPTPAVDAKDKQKTLTDKAPPEEAKPAPATEPKPAS